MSESGHRGRGGIATKLWFKIFFALVVVSIFLTLFGRNWVPSPVDSPDRSKLRPLRTATLEYSAQYGKHPQSINQLIEHGFIDQKELPPRSLESDPTKKQWFDAFGSEPLATYSRVLKQSRWMIVPQFREVVVSHAVLQDGRLKYLVVQP